MSPVATLVERSTSYLTLVCLPTGHRTGRGGLLAHREPENGILALQDARTCRWSRWARWAQGTGLGEQGGGRAHRRGL